MQFILHRVYYKGVYSIFCIPAHLPSDTNEACFDVNTSSTLAGGNVLLLTTKATQNLLAQGGGHIPPQLSMMSSEMGPSTLVEFNLLKRVKYYQKSKNHTSGRRALWSGCSERTPGHCCLVCPRCVEHPAGGKSSGKGGLQEASVQGRTFSYVTTKAPTYITKSFW